MLRQVALRAIAGAAAALAIPSTTLAQTSTMTTLRLILAPGDDLLPFWYAQSKDMFRAAGLNLTVQMSAGSPIVEAVVGGAADIGKTQLTTLVVGRAKGIPFVLVAPGAIHGKESAVNAAIMVSATSPLRSALDLQGKTVSCSALGDLGYLGLRAMIDAQGGDSSTVRWVEIPMSAVAAALEQGRIDAGISTEPFMTRDLAVGKVKPIVDMLNGYQGTILETAFFSMGPYANANRDALTRFARVMAQATAYTNAHTTELIPLLVSNAGMDPDIAARMKHALVAPTFEPSEVQPLIDVAVRYKSIAKRFDAREMFMSASR